MTTTTSYGTWCNRVDPYSTSLEASVEDALGDFASDYDVDGLVAAYRRAINDALPPSVSLCGDEFIGPWQPGPGEFDDYPHDEYGGLDIRAIVNSVDFWQLAEKFDKTAKDAERDHTANEGEDHAKHDDQMPFESADAWADALDAEMAKTGKTAGDLISEGYADGSLLGVSLNPEAPEADDERGVIVSTNGWVVYYDEQAGYWYSR